MFGADVIKAAKQHAIDSWPNESVGYVAAHTYFPQVNISPTPSLSFEVDPSAWVSVTNKAGAIQAVIHSHPMHPYTDERGIVNKKACDYPNAFDMTHQVASGVPWGILTCDHDRANDPFFFGDGVPILPLTGPQRYFRHGVTDCYSLIRDFYMVEYGIRLKEFPRDWDWWNPTAGIDGCAIPKDLYALGFSQTGFRAIDASEVKRGDLFLAQLPRVSVTCHGGLYLGGPGDMILHHLCSGLPVDRTRIAVEEPGARYLKYVTYFLRHEERE